MSKVRHAKGVKLSVIFITAAILVFSCFFIVFSLNKSDGPASAAVVTGAALDVGDYFYFGTAINAAGIRWRVIQKDNVNGRLLVRADRSVANNGGMAYSGSWKSNRNDTEVANLDGNTTDYKRRQVYGTNLWLESDMRTWLNTTGASSGSYTFRDNFTDAEWALIRSVPQRQYLADVDRNGSNKTGFTDMAGGSGHPYITDINNVANTTDPWSSGANGWCKYTMDDKMFLLDVYQNYLLTQGDAALLRNAAGNSYRIVVNKAGAQQWSWTRTPYAANSHAVRGVNTDGSLYGHNASASTGAVAPAFYIGQSDILLNGKGVNEVQNTNETRKYKEYAQSGVRYKVGYEAEQEGSNGSLNARSEEGAFSSDANAVSVGDLVFTATVTDENTYRVIW